MKRLFITLVIVIISSLTVSLYAQKKVTVKLQQVKLEDVFSAITKQTGLTFAYSRPNVNPNKIVSLNVEDAELSKALSEVFAGTNISFDINTDKIYLTEKQQVPTSPDGIPEKVLVKGVATDVDGSPLIGAGVVEKGTTNGTQVDVDGTYQLSVLPNSRLVFSLIGYNPIEVAVNGKVSIDVVMKEDVKILDEVVVTALGIKKKEKSLTYSTQQISGDDLTRVKDPNLINALAGKTAGVQINKSSSGLGGSSKVVIRGGRSLSRSNQPLYVIDGMPMSNSVSAQPSTVLGGNNDGGGRDSGDGIANLNSDDIESMNILKGPAAAALYGSEAANGVILITTKKGKSGATRIDFSSNVSFDMATQTPKLQKNYYGDWGAKLDKGSQDYKDDFFRTGNTVTNSVAMSSGTDVAQSYISYANTAAKGIVPENSMMKHNFNFRQTSKFFNNRLSMDANVNLVNQTIKNRPVAGGYYLNPLTGLYRFPQGSDMGQYRDGGGYQVWDKQRNLYTQNWLTNSDRNQNPYWLTNMIPSNDKRNRVIASLTASLKVTDWMTLQARGSIDYTSDRYNQKMHVGTSSVIAKGGNGRYIVNNGEEMTSYGDVMATFSPKLQGPFGIQGTVGSSIKDTHGKGEVIDSNPNGLHYANVFTLKNATTRNNIVESYNDQVQMQSIFGTAQLSYNDYLFLDVSARNDWSSTLAYTKSTSFFYPSFGLTGVVSEMATLPQWMSFAKVRGAWAQVGNTIPIYASRYSGGLTSSGNYLPTDRAPYGDMEPEKTTSIEAGFELKFLQNRLDFDLTLYKTNTKNQHFVLPAPAGSPYAYNGALGGNIENKGLEIVLGGSPVMTNDFVWKTSVNYAINRNKVKELHKDLPVFFLGSQTATGNYQMKVVEGGSIGDIYGTAFERDANGQIVYNADTGLPSKILDATTKIGNASPKYNVGWSNSFSYKDFTLSFLIDMRIGGDVLSITQSDLDNKGATKEVAKARDKGHVMLEGHKIDNVQGFYQDVVGADFGAGVAEYYMYDGTNIRLRELSLGYTLNQKLLRKQSAIKNASISLVARNLFFFKNNAPFDPDAILSTGNDLQGVDVFGMPSTRSFGVNLKLTF